MIRFLYYTAVFFLSMFITSISADAQMVQNSGFDRKIKSLIKFQVPVIDVVSAYKNFDNIVFLDARKREEYDISHIQNSYYVGYDDFDILNLPEIEKDSTVVVYCSIGYRSEKIGMKLKKSGYTNVYNLYGSIFEWTNRGYPIVDNNNNATNHLHTYNKKWSKWVDNPEIVKIW